MQLSKKEIVFSVVSILVLSLVWIFFPKIEVSSKTSAKYTIINPHQISWKSGTGIEINTVYISSRENIKSYPIQIPTQILDNLLKNNTVFLLEVREDAKRDNYLIDIPAHIDAFLKDDLGNTYKPKNQDMAKKFKSKKLEELLISIFENTITNNGPLGTIDTVAYGLLVFSKIDPKAKKIILEIPRVFDSEANIQGCRFSFEL